MGLRLLLPTRPNEFLHWEAERQSGPWEDRVSPPPGCVPDVASGEVKEDSVIRTAVTVSVFQQPPRSQLFLHEPWARAAVTASVPAWTGILHLAMEIPTMPTHPAINAYLHLESRATLRRRRLRTAGCRLPCL